MQRAAASREGSAGIEAAARDSIPEKRGVCPGAARGRRRAVRLDADLRVRKSAGRGTPTLPGTAPRVGGEPGETVSGACEFFASGRAARAEVGDGAGAMGAGASERDRKSSAAGAGAAFPVAFRARRAAALARAAEERDLWRRERIQRAGAE